MKTVGNHGPAQILSKRATDLLDDCKETFLDNQINGVEFMLQRSCGKIPINANRSSDKNVADATKSLKSVQTYDEFVVNTMGFGKTCITPSGVVLHQWQEAITKFPNLTLIIPHGDKPSYSKFTSN